MGRPKKAPKNPNDGLKLTKRIKRKHDPEVVQWAIENVKAKRYSLREAAKAFNIPASTLSDYCSGKMPVKPAFTLLTPGEEEKLRNYLLGMARCGFGLTTDEVRATTKALIDLRRPPPSDKPDLNLPSPSWVYRYFGRHPEITLRTPQSLDKERALVTPPAIINWFSTMKAYVDSIDPELLSDGTRIYNADESGFAFDPQARRVISFVGAKHVYKVTAKIKTQVTVLACMSAAGHFIKPLIVYPYKHLPSHDLTRDFHEAMYNFSDSGWMTAAIFYSWLNDVFIPSTRHVKKPLLLLVDGHASHSSLIETSLICEENGIIMYCFIPHASHLIQPLDQAFFCSVNSAWTLAARQHLLSTGDTVDLESFASILRPVWDKCCTRKIAKKSFRCAGIFPFNPDRAVSSGKFGPSSIYRPPATSKSTIEVSSQEPVNISPHKIVVETPAAPVQISFPQSLNQDLNKILQAPVSPSSPILDTFHHSIEVEDEIGGTPAMLLPPLSTACSTLTEQDSSSQETAYAPSTACPVATPTASTAADIARSFAPSSASRLMNFEQLHAFKNMMDFVLDDVTRNEFNSFFAVLVGTRPTPINDDKFDTFLKLLVKFRDTNFSAHCSSSQQVKRTSVEDVQQISRFAANKGKRAKKTTPTIPHCISSKDFRKAMEKKIDQKDEEEKAKLARKADREAKTKKRDEDKEMAKRKRELAKE